MKDDFTPTMRDMTPQGSTIMLSDKIMAQLDDLQSDRILAFARAVRKPEPKVPSALERDVDALLDSVNDLNRLHQLAQLASRGGFISVEADRLLIANHAETFQSLVARYAERSGIRPPEYGLLPATPRSIE